MGVMQSLTWVLPGGDSKGGLGRPVVYVAPSTIFSLQRVSLSGRMENLPAHHYSPGQRMVKRSTAPAANDTENSSRHATYRRRFFIYYFPFSEFRGDVIPSGGSPEILSNPGAPRIMY